MQPLSFQNVDKNNWLLVCDVPHLKRNDFILLLLVRNFYTSIIFNHLKTKVLLQTRLLKYFYYIHIMILFKKSPILLISVILIFIWDLVIDVSYFLLVQEHSYTQSQSFFALKDVTMFSFQKLNNDLDNNIVKNLHIFCKKVLVCFHFLLPFLHFGV